MTRYGSAAAFHQALEERLKKQPGAHQVKRNLLAIQRLLWRLSMVNEDVIVKGGIALRLRSERARTTSDLDLRLGGDRAKLEATLRSAVQTPADDFMSWEFAWTKALEAVDGQRFRVHCVIGGRPFSSFDVDFAPPEPLVGEVERVVGADWLSFSGVPTPDFRVYPLTTQLAEKLHAYTRPRDQTNTRVKDLPDIVLIGTLSDGLRRSELVEALRTHLRPPTNAPCAAAVRVTSRDLALALREARLTERPAVGVTRRGLPAGVALCPACARRGRRRPLGRRTVDMERHAFQRVSYARTRLGCLVGHVPLPHALRR